MSEIKKQKLKSSQYQGGGCDVKIHYPEGLLHTFTDIKSLNVREILGFICSYRNINLPSKLL